MTKQLSRKTLVEQRPHYVYRHYDADGQILYIGCTSDPDARFAAQRTNRDSKEWYARVVHTDVIGPMTYAEALHAETWAIRADLPPHNIDIPRARTLKQIRFMVWSRRVIGRGEPLEGGPVR